MRSKKLFVALATCALFLPPLSSYSYGSSDYDEHFTSAQAQSPDNDYSSSQSSDSNYAQGDDDTNYAYNDSSYYASRRSYYSDENYRPRHSHHHSYDSHDSHYSRLPQHISPLGEKAVIVDPRVHAWGAYSADGTLIRSGMASAGSNYCRDIRRPCRTRTGSFRIHSLGSRGCKSTRYPLPRGGAPMPYCMYFNGNQGLHGSHEVANANISHGCVRMHVQDAEWLRFNFVNMGTKVIVRPY